MRGTVALVLAAVALAACSGPMHPYEIEEGFELPASARLYLAPMNSNTPLASELVDGAERVHARVRSTLAAHDLFFVEDPYRDFRRTWGGAFRSVERVDPRDGESADLPADGVQRLFEALRGPERDFEWLLVPELVGRAARIGGHVVRWDGVRRQLEGVHSAFHGSGHVRAVSLRLRLYDAHGQVVFDSYGGLDLLFHVDWYEGRWAQLPDLLAIEEHLDEGVAVAFHPLLVAPD